MKGYHKVKKSQGIQENILIVNVINNELIATEHKKYAKVINAYAKRRGVTGGKHTDCITHQNVKQVNSTAEVNMSSKRAVTSVSLLRKLNMNVHLNMFIWSPGLQMVA